MLSFRSFFGRSTSKAGKPAPRQQKSRSAYRPRLECLEDRTLLNARFVVPIGAPVDNVTNFATLSSALTSPGLVNGDSITIRAGSAPGQVTGANLAAAAVTNLTIQGDPSVDSSLVPQFQVTTASTFTAAQAGFTLKNVNVGLLGTGQLVFNTNVTITDSTLVNINAGQAVSTGAIVFGGTQDILTHSTLVDNSGTGSNLLAITATAGGSNQIIGNELIENGTTNAAIAYVGATASSVTDRIFGNIITANSTTGPLGQGIVIAAPVSGLTIQDNTISDNGAAAGATVGIDVAAGAAGTAILDNHISLLGAGSIGVRIAAGTTGGTFTSASLLFNEISTNGGGSALQVLVTAASTATDILNVSAQGNDFHNNQYGVYILTGANTTPSNLVVDLGGGGSSQGGNDFRNTPVTASGSGGAIVVTGTNPASSLTIQAQNDLFTAGFAAAGSVSGGGLANVSINVNGSLTGGAAFVETIYERLLHRVGAVNDPSDAGAAVGVDPSLVALSAVRSAEGLGVQVNSLYERILGRVADDQSRGNAIGFLQNGGTIEQLIVLMVGSDEYRGRFGSQAGYVQSLYNLLLGRSASQQEVDNTVAALVVFGNTAVANDFVTSSEFRSGVASELYGGMSGATSRMASSVFSLFPDLLHRRASSGEVSNTANTGLDLLSLEVMFASSPEFFSNG